MNRRSLGRWLGAGLGGALLGSTGALAAPVAPRVKLAPLTGPIRIMVAGHSIAAGYGGSGIGDRWAWGSWLRDVCGLDVSFVGPNSSGTPVQYARHAGYGDRTVAQFGAMLPGILAAYPCEILVLRLGVNDMKAPLYRSAEQVLTDYQAVVATAQAARPGLRVVASQEIPPNGSQGLRDGRGREYAIAGVQVRRFNIMLNAWVAERNAAGDDSICTVPNSMILSDLLVDGLHPGDIGYGAMAFIAMHAPNGPWRWVSDQPAPMVDSAPFKTWPFGI